MRLRNAKGQFIKSPTTINPKTPDVPFRLRDENGRFVKNVITEAVINAARESGVPVEADIVQQYYNQNGEFINSIYDTFSRVTPQDNKFFPDSGIFTDTILKQIRDGAAVYYNVDGELIKQDSRDALQQLWEVKQGLLNALNSPAQIWDIQANLKGDIILPDLNEILERIEEFEEGEEDVDLSEFGAYIIRSSKKGN